MTQKLKALGLALIAAGAMSAMVASAAQGHAAFTVEKLPATVTGVQVGAPLSFTTTHGTFNCTSVTSSGAATELEATDLSLNTAYSGCKVAGLNASVDMTGCVYTYTAKATEPANDPNTISATIHILCPPEKKMHVKVVGATCELTVGPQTIENGIILHNAGGPGKEMDITATLDITGITYTIHNPLNCPNPGGSATGLRHNGTLKGHTTLTSHDGNPANKIGITVH